MLLIPSGFLLSLIGERESYKNEGLKEVSSKWGSTQNVGGPVIIVPIVSETVVKDTKVSSVVDYVKILPSNLVVTGGVVPEVRYRGIYEYVLYSSKINFAGNFDFSGVGNLKLYNGNLKWEDATLQVGISDMIGIKELVNLKWGNTEYSFSPGVKNNDVFSSGLATSIKFSERPNDGKYPFSFDLNIKGSQELTFLPLGKETIVNLDSNWGNPSFSGAFLPEERLITQDNFKAKWKVLDLNRNYPQEWLGQINGQEITESKFGINFLIPIDAYKQTNRAVKYMIMFVGLTFIIFFFAEIMNKRKIHPVQYLLVGFSLVIFYLLLISISEHVSFYKAYFISSFFTVLVITLYSLSVFRARLFSIIVGTELVALYGFLFVLLLNQDYSLLIGSCGIFIVISLIMYFTRNIDWYGLDLKDNSK
jgi:inner membrane protein